MNPLLGGYLQGAIKKMLSGWYETFVPTIIAMRVAFLVKEEYLRQ